MNSKFGDVENPLLLSVRSGARASMPGMMDTILNLDSMTRLWKVLHARQTIPILLGTAIAVLSKCTVTWFWYEAVNKLDIDPFEAIIDQVKKESGVLMDQDLSVDDLKRLVKLFKATVKSIRDMTSECAMEQLWGAICAVFGSWHNDRAILYRKMEGIPDEWGTAVTVMAMVFGNMGNTHHRRMLQP